MHAAVLPQGGGATGGWRQRAVTRPCGSGLLRGERGMVSAELAIALPALILITMALAWLLGLGASQAMLSQAAREGARAAARGEGTQEITRAVHQVVGDARVGVRRSGGLAIVDVAVRRAPGPPMLQVLGRDLRASATAWQERP